MSFAADIAAADRAALSLLGGVDVTYTPAVGSSVVVQGIFDENYRRHEPGELDMSQTTPAVFLRREDLPVDIETDEPTLTINGRQYQVYERRTDGDVGGGIMLLLHRSDL